MKKETLLRKLIFLLVLFLSTFLASCYSLYIGVVDVPLDNKWIRENIVYHSGQDIDSRKQTLDFYTPPDQSHFPVLIFVHGGAWRSGDKREYKYLGKFFAYNGIGTAIVNYRLSPGVKHPIHIEDVAVAFAWVYQNVKSFGGNPDKIFMMGHSAGAHLSALLALDKKYLEARGLSPDLIRGTIVLDGLYDLRVINNKWAWLSRIFFAPVFGDDPQVKTLASPIIFVRNDCSPFLIIQGENDFLVSSYQPVKFFNALIEEKTEAELVFIPHRDHITIMTSMGKPGDLTTQIILSFIEKHSS